MQPAGLWEPLSAALRLGPLARAPAGLSATAWPQEPAVWPVFQRERPAPQRRPAQEPETPREHWPPGHNRPGRSRTGHKAARIPRLGNVVHKNGHKYWPRTYRPGLLRPQPAGPRPRSLGSIPIVAWKHPPVSKPETELHQARQVRVVTGVTQQRLARLTPTPLAGRQAVTPSPLIYTVPLGIGNSLPTLNLGIRLIALIRRRNCLLPRAAENGGGHSTIQREATFAAPVSRDFGV